MSRRRTLVVGVAAIAVTLAGCGTAVAPKAVATTTTTTTKTATTASIPTTTTAAPAAATPPRCQTPKLDVWGAPTPGGGYAGGYGFTINFTDFGRACTLSGYPGVSAVNIHNVQLGRPAAQSPPPGAVVTIAYGGTATAVVLIADPGSFPSAACVPAQAARLRVFPPGSRRSVLINYPFPACSRRGQGGAVYLMVKWVT
jgi:uncharacterized protein DUF4232